MLSSKGHSRKFAKIPLVAISGLVVAALIFGVSTVWAGGGPNVNGAKLYIKQDKLDDAKNVLNNELEKVDPNNEDAWYLLGYIYAREGKYDKMLQAFNKAGELEPKLKEKGVKVNGDPGKQFRAEYGIDMIERIVWGSAFNSGVNHFNKAIQATTDSARTENYEKAIDDFKVSSEIQPDSTMGYRNWAAALMNLGKYEESIEPLKQAIERNPDDYESMTMLSSVYMTTQKDSLALPLLENLWQKGQHTKDVMDLLARLYLKEGKTDQALAIFKDAVAQSPDNYEVRYNYGVVLLETQQYDGAIEQFKKAYEMNPDSPDLNYNLGAAYLNRGVAKREALPEDSEDTSYLKDFKDAYPYLEKSILMNPDDQQVWMTLGRIAGQLNKIALAGYALSKGEDITSAFDQKVVVGMQPETLREIFGEPDQIRPLESEDFAGVEEWIYNKRPATNGKAAVPQSIHIYVKDDRVDALMVIK